MPSTLHSVDVVLTTHLGVLAGKNKTLMKMLLEVSEGLFSGGPMQSQILENSFEDQCKLIDILQ